MSQADQAALQARNRLLAVFVAFCILDVVLVFIVRDVWAIGRILFTIIVMYFVLQGRRWAKWLLIAICGLLSISLVALVIALSSQLSSVVIVGSLVMILLSAIIPIYMVRNTNLNRYFSWQRQYRSR
ncbi:MAG: hypothetical protein ACFBSC_15735 [Microcoleaceae cyanobacterium]